MSTTTRYHYYVSGHAFIKTSPEDEDPIPASISTVIVTHRRVLTDADLDALTLRVTEELSEEAEESGYELADAPTIRQVNFLHETNASEEDDGK